MIAMLLQKCQAVGHPNIEPALRMFGNLAHDVYAIFEPG